MNEIADDRYCSTKINQTRMFKKTFIRCIDEEKQPKKNQCMTIEAILKEKKNEQTSSRDKKKTTTTTDKRKHPRLSKQREEM